MGLNLKRLNDQHGLIWGINTIYQGGSHWMQCSCKNLSRGPRHCLYCPRLCLGQYRQCLGPCDIFTILSSAAPWTIFLHIHLTNDILLDIYTNTKVKETLFGPCKFWSKKMSPISNYELCVKKNEPIRINDQVTWYEV